MPDPRYQLYLLIYASNRTVAVLPSMIQTGAAEDSQRRKHNKNIVVKMRLMYGAPLCCLNG